ncbi:MAG: FAD-dependent oxidoreductase [Lachnospiraceae bacterium]|nr:FAD-dependent oxidoreductase [Lachnospiraceae bacterium]
MYDYLIVGAGIFGAVCARELTDAGHSCLVIDKRDHIAGNAYTANENGIIVHEYGAHIFHTSIREVWDYVNRFAEFNNYINSPVARYGDELYNLPFNMNTFSKMWGIATPDEARKIIDDQIRELNIGEPANLEEQALKMVGRDVYEKLVKGYTEKQWGRKCSELPSFIIRRLPLRFTFDNNYFNDRYQGIPIGGYTAMIEKMLEGIEVRLGCDYFAMKKAYESGKADSAAGCSTAGPGCSDRPAGLGIARHVIYTGPVDEFFGYSAGTLEYRSLRFEKETLPTDNFQGCAVVNYTAADVPYTRIIEHRHFEFGKLYGGDDTPHTVITKEYPAAWKPGDEPYYPVNNDRNNEMYAKYAEMAKNCPDVTFGGRLGCYKYYDMDKTVAAALETVKNLV